MNEIYLNIMDKTHKPAHINPAKRKMRDLTREYIFVSVANIII